MRALDRTLVVLRTLCALTALIVLPGVGWAQAYLTAQLSGPQEEPPLAVPGRGTASVTLLGSDLYYSLTVEGLSGAPTAAHFHRGRRGENGPVLFDIGGSFLGPDFTTANGVISGLTTTQVAELLSGGLYLNVHTAANPGGEVRGQVDLSAGTHLSADLNGNEENPPVATPGRGTGAFTLTDEGLYYDVTVTGLTGPITAAHFHNAEVGANGGVVLNIGASFSGNRGTGFWPRGAAAPDLTPALVRELLAGRLYVNVHTAANPGGEVRGQVTVASGFGLSAKMDGGQEVPPVGTPGQGSASFTLTPSGLVFDITVSGLSGAITAAHFHRAPAGSNGGVVRNITTEFTGTTAYGVWTPQDSSPLTPDLVCDILEGNVYVNVHTAANPGGEVRGQLVLNDTRTTLTATLAGVEEEPPTGSAGRGTGSFRMGPAGLEFDLSVDGLSGPITAAHIHRAAIGTNGGVVFDLGPAFGGTNHARGVWAAPALADVKDLLRGNLYVNVHTAANPGGEIRGQILLASGAGIVFPLHGSQEEPPVTTSGVGTGSATLTSEGLLLNVTFDALSAAFSAAHIHQAATGSNGGVVRDLTAAFSGGHAEDVWSPADAAPLTQAFRDQALLGGLYVNVHSAAHPAGEIRGQLILADGFYADAELNGGAEVPPAGTSALGTGTFRATENALVYNVSYDGLEGAFTASHFHRGAVGTNGPVVLDITGSYLNGSSRGVWSPASAPGLSAADVCDFLAGDLYVNIHSSVFPSGEIRGNLSDLTPADAPEVSPASRLQLQAFPNPSTGLATIQYQLPRAGQVRISLHAADGSRVSVLRSGEQEAGLHQVELDGRGLSTGVYFVRVRSTAGDAVVKWLRLE